MSKFKDRKGDEWDIELNVGSVADVKKGMGINLALVSKDRSWINAVFGGDDEEAGRQLVGILYVLCEEQCGPEGHDLTPEEFARRFNGPTLEAAGVALADAIADFFPRSAVAKAVKAGMATLMTEADRRTVAALEKQITTACASPATDGFELAHAAGG